MPRRPIHRPAIVGVLAAVAVLGTVTASPVQADQLSDDDVVAAGEGSDIAVPATDAEAQLAVAGVAPAVGSSAAFGPIEDYDYDPLLTKGRAGRVCNGGLRTGTAWAFSEVVARFGGSAGTLYSCRERYAVFEDPDCDGTTVDPVTNPRFFSDCWSNHAQGRAFDVMVGTSGGTYNTWRGDAIVDWLLAPDAAGNPNAMARRLGVQQFLWYDRCWNSEGDRGISSADEMRECGYGHFDHIHVDLSLAGSEGRTTYWGFDRPKPVPKLNNLLAWDKYGADGWSVQRWTNLARTPVSTGGFGTEWDQIVAGDFDADGRLDDTFLWDQATGAWKISSWNSGRPTTRSSGTWSRRFDLFVAGDFDRDLKVDDLLAWDRTTGAWTVTRFDAFQPGARRRGTWSTAFDRAINGDWNSNGRREDLLLWDLGTGRYTVQHFTGLVPRAVGSGRFNDIHDAAVPGDFDAQGKFDELFLWDDASGAYALYTWRPGFVPVREDRGAIWSGWERVVAGDFDTDGRIDDMFLWDQHTGRFKIRSWHRFDAADAGDGLLPTRLDTFVSGTWS